MRFVAHRPLGIFSLTCLLTAGGLASPLLAQSCEVLERTLIDSAGNMAEASGQMSELKDLMAEAQTAEEKQQIKNIRAAWVDEYRTASRQVVKQVRLLKEKECLADGN